MPVTGSADKAQDFLPKSFKWGVYACGSSSMNHTPSKTRYTLRFEALLSHFEGYLYNCLVIRKAFQGNGIVFYKAPSVLIQIQPI